MRSAAAGSAATSRLRTAVSTTKASLKPLSTPRNGPVPANSVSEGCPRDNRSIRASTAGGSNTQPGLRQRRQRNGKPQRLHHARQLLLHHPIGRHHGGAGMGRRLLRRVLAPRHHDAGKHIGIGEQVAVMAEIHHRLDP